MLYRIYSLKYLFRVYLDYIVSCFKRFLILIDGNREDIRFSEDPAAGGARLRHHQPSLSAGEDLASTHNRLFEDF